MKIEIKNVSYKINRVEILKDISFTLKSGSFTAIIGPNGAGKSTLIKIMLGLLMPTNSNFEIKYDDISVDEVNAKFHWLGYVPQNFSFNSTIPLTIDEFLKFSCGNFLNFNQNYNNILETLNLSSIKFHPISYLSGGEIQRLLIAYNLLQNKKVLFLDEPTSAIDIEGENLIYSILNDINKKLKINIIIVSHDIDTVLKNVDTIICLNKTIHCIGSACEIINDNFLKLFFEKHKGLYQHGGCQHNA